MRNDRRPAATYTARLLPVLLGLLHPILAARPAAAAETILIRAARVYPVAGAPIPLGKVVVRDGRITEVGSEVSVKPMDPGVRVIDVRGSLVPGFIDCGSSAGVRGRRSEEFRELTPEIRVLDAVDPDHPELRRALEAGVTVVAVSPGPRNVIGGIGAVIRTDARERGIDAVVLARDAFLEASLSEEASSGNLNLRFSRPFTYTFRLPNTRMGTVFLVRRAFLEALDRVEPGEAPRMLTPDGKRLLRDALAGRMPLRLHADYRQELLTALRICDEFSARVHVVGAGEAMSLVPRLADKRVPVILYPGTTFRDESAQEHPEHTARLPELLARAGVPFAFGSDDGDEVPLLRERAAFCVRFGLAGDAALEALTLGAARILGVQDRIGSIEPGKDADLVAIAGDPLDVSAPVSWVMVAGRPAAGAMEREL